MFAEAQLRKWWDGRSDNERSYLKEAAEKTKLEPPTVKMLFDTGCPVSPVGTRWASQPEFDWYWPEDVRAFISEQ